MRQGSQSEARVSGPNKDPLTGHGKPIRGALGDTVPVTTAQGRKTVVIWPGDEGEEETLTSGDAVEVNTAYLLEPSARVERPAVLGAFRDLEIDHGLDVLADGSADALG